MRPVWKRCGVKPAALDGNGEQLDWCIDCIWKWIQRELPRGGMKGDMINDMIDRALVSMLIRGLKKFTANDVQAETIKLDERGTFGRRLLLRTEMSSFPMKGDQRRIGGDVHLRRQCLGSCTSKERPNQDSETRRSAMVWILTA